MTADIRHLDEELRFRGPFGRSAPKLLTAPLLEQPKPEKLPVDLGLDKDKVVTGGVRVLTSERFKKEAVGQSASASAGAADMTDVVQFGTVKVPR